MTGLTVTGLKSWAKENKALAKSVCLAKALAQTEKARVDVYAEDLFTDYNFTDEDGEKITTYHDLWLSDEDATEFYTAVDKAHREHGFEGPEGHCPALVAESLSVDAENAMLDSFGEFVGVGGSDKFSGKLRAKALDLALGACLGQLT